MSPTPALKPPALVLYTMDEAAAQLSVSRRWLTAFIKKHPIPCRMAGRKVLFDERALRVALAYMRAGNLSEGEINMEIARISEMLAPMDPTGGGFVYFVQCGPHVKIGFTRSSPESRIQDLQTGSAEPLTLLHCEAGSERDERRLHRAFKPYHVNREWFSLAGELAEFIERRKH